MCDTAQADVIIDTRQPTADMPDITPIPAGELNRFYALRANRTAWSVSDDAAVKKTLAFIDSVGALVAYHGLDADGYQLDTMRQLTASKADADKQKLEVLSNSNHTDAVNQPFVPIY